MTLEMGKGLEYMLLKKPEGIEASDYTVTAEDNIQADGVTVIEKRVEKRPIALDFEYPDVDDSTEEKRQQLIRFFNPKKTGNLMVNYMGIKRMIDYEVVSFKDKQESMYSSLKCHVELICPNPFFKDIIEDTELIATWIGGWKWKWSFPYKFKERGPKQKNVYYDGHVDTPLEIIFRGPAVNPLIRNATTGESIKILRTLNEGDALYINTAYGHKTAEISRNDGALEDVMDYLDPDFDFFQLYVGDNLIEYETDNELNPQSVELRYHKRYLGV